MPKLTLQVKIQLIILFVLSAFFVSAQNKSECTVHHKDGKVYVEVLVQLEETEHIVSSEDFCEQGTSLSFCFRNYLNEKLDVLINDSEELDFIIEASLANTTKIQINLSAETTATTINSIDITNNTFVDDVQGFENVMTVTLNGVETNAILNAANRTMSVN